MTLEEGATVTLEDEGVGDDDDQILQLSMCLLCCRSRSRPEGSREVHSGGGFWKNASHCLRVLARAAALGNPNISTCPSYLAVTSFFVPGVPSSTGNLDSTGDDDVHEGIWENFAHFPREVRAVRTWNLDRTWNGDITSTSPSYGGAARRKGSRGSFWGNPSVGLT